MMVQQRSGSAGVAGVNWRCLEWTEALTLEVVRLWNEGLSAGIIAERLRDVEPRLTRSAIIGKVNRLKLPPRQTVAQLSSSPFAGKTVVDASALRERLKQAREAKRQKAIARANRDVQKLEEIAAVEAAAAIHSDAWAPIPGTTPVPIDAHKEGQCRWPVGDPLSPSFGYCGARSGVRSYCDHHNTIAWRQPQ
jgi:GcrA cell cycle regulator